MRGKAQGDGCLLETTVLFLLFVDQSTPAYVRILKKTSKCAMPFSG